MSPPSLRYREYAPAAPLRRWVECYWSCTGVPPTPWVQSVLPDGCMDLVLSDAQDGAPGFMVVGTQRQAMSVPLTLSVSMFGIRFRPAGLPAFVPVHARDLVDGAAPLDDVIAKAAATAINRLAEAPMAERTRLADGALLDRLSGIAPDRFVDRALDVLRARRGSPGTSSLADRLGMSRRTLERRFLATVGIGPGALARILRFRRATDRMVARPDLGLSRIAYDAGYADQPHFSRDVRALTGQTPGQLRGPQRDV